jgi:uncharacterized protein YbaR (Trm112 family)
MREGSPYRKGHGVMGTGLGHKRTERPRARSGLEASQLYCPRCKSAMPVRERLLLVLPDGELHEYLCVRCGTSVGERTTREERQVRILLPS